MAAKMVFVRFWGGDDWGAKHKSGGGSCPGKATDFRFGHYIHRVHPNKSPLKNLEERERGRI